MNIELERNIHKKAYDYVDEEHRVTRSEFVAYIAGSRAMYAELSPLVEWVSVEDRLPETGKIVLVKNDLEDISTGCFTGKIFKIDFDEISSKKVTHWRRIEL